MQRYENAQLEFSAAISLPPEHPDRARRIKHTAEVEASARNELWRAIERSDDFHNRGIVPKIVENGLPASLR